MRSNSLPSGSANVVQRAEPWLPPRIGDAPSAASRCDSASTVLLMRARCSRFFTDFGSGTWWKLSRGVVPSGSSVANSVVAPGEISRPRASAQKRASFPASAASTLRPYTELLMSVFLSGQAGSDGGAAAVDGDGRAGDVAGLPRSGEPENPG